MSAEYAGPPLWHVLLALGLVAGVLSWLAVHESPTVDEPDPLTLHDMTTDAAVELLFVAAPGDYGQLYRTCPGCDKDVWRGDLTEHGRVCAPLRALVLQRQ